MAADIIAGSAAQIGMVRRAQALHALLQDDPRFCFQARSVSYVDYTPEAAAMVVNLARLQGYASVQFTPREKGPELADAFREAGLSPVEWDQYWGRDAAISASRAFLEGFAAPEGLTLKEVTAKTDDATIRAICATAVAQGVVPPPGSAMRGQGQRGVFLYVTGPGGAVVALGGGFMSYHPASRRADEAFWGMLATDKAWRGHRLASWVGAEAVRLLHHRYGANGFSSGVKADNPASQAMCRRLGITRSGRIYAGASDPLLMGSGPVTR